MKGRSFVNCPKCNTAVSPEQDVCPKCGRALKKNVVLDSDLVYFEEDLTPNRRRIGKPVILIIAAVLICVAAAVVVFVMRRHAPASAPAATEDTATFAVTSEPFSAASTVPETSVGASAGEEGLIAYAERTGMTQTLKDAADDKMNLAVTAESNVLMAVYTVFEDSQAPDQAEYFEKLKTDFDRFLEETNGVLPAEKLRAHKTLAKLGLRTAAGLKLSFAAKLGKVWRSLTPQQKKAAKQTKLFDVLFTILRHIYPGNAPYTPDTLEYTVLHALMQRLDRLVEKHKIEKVQKLIPPGSSLTEMGEDFLYNNRTGDDNAIRLNLNTTSGKEGDSVS